MRDSLWVEEPNVCAPQAVAGGGYSAGVGAHPSSSFSGGLGRLTIPGPQPLLIPVGGSCCGAFITPGQPAQREERSRVGRVFALLSSKIFIKMSKEYR